MIKILILVTVFSYSTFAYAEKGKSFESAFLEGHSQLASRHKDVLELRPPGADKSIKFINADCAKPATCATYEIQDYIEELSAFAIKMNLYEREVYKLVSSRLQTDLREIPHLSSDSKWIVEASASETDWQGLAVYSVETNIINNRPIVIRVNKVWENEAPLFNLKDPSETNREYQAFSFKKWLAKDQVEVSVSQWLPSEKDPKKKFVDRVAILKISGKDSVLTFK